MAPTANTSSPRPSTCRAMPSTFKRDAERFLRLWGLSHQRNYLVGDAQRGLVQLVDRSIARISFGDVAGPGMVDQPFG